MDACCSPGRGAPSRGRDADGTAGAAPAAGATPRLATIPAGTFAMGEDGPLAQPYDGEGPVRDVTLSSYEIGVTTVSVGEFAAFVEATGHVTDAEAFGWSFVVQHLVSDASAVRGRVPGAAWWCGVDGADWRHPGGPLSTADRDHPVVHVSWGDAVAYAAWVGGRLPSEEEWERAARGGLARATYPWGDDLQPDGEWRLNTWQGRFPEHDTGADGWAGTAPVDAYPPNGFGLHQVVGNVWEWTASPWTTRPGGGRVRRGGSYLCHESYCFRYRVSARDGAQETDTTGHTGFRVARSDQG